MANRSGYRRLVLRGFGVMLCFSSLYGLLGFFQAAMLFTGVRALKNANIWASVFLVSVALALVCFAYSRRSVTALVGRRATAALTLWITCFFVSAGAVWRVFRDYGALDSCLDVGGSFDYVLSACDFSATHPALSLFAWRGFFLVSALVFALPALLAVAKWWAHRQAGEANAL